MTDTVITADIHRLFSTTFLDVVLTMGFLGLVPHMIPQLGQYFSPLSFVPQFPQYAIMDSSFLFIHLLGYLKYSKHGCGS